MKISVNVLVDCVGEIFRLVAFQGMMVGVPSGYD